MAEIEKESTDKTGPAERRRHALPGRAVPPLHVQEIHRRPPRLRPRVRRSPSSAATRTTSSIPATTSTSASSAPTRTASRPGRALPEVEHGRLEGRRPGLRRRPPGRTNRLNTVANLEYLRDVALPVPARLSCTTAEAFLLEYGKRGPRQFRQSKEDLFSIQNSRKARDRRPRRACRTRRSWPARREAEKALRDADRGRPREARRPTAPPGTRSPRPQKVAAEIAQALQLPRARARLRLRTSSGSPGPRPARRGEGQAERRPAQRVPRLRPRVARARALLRGPDLPRVREGQARPLAGLLEEAHARRPAGRAGPPGPDARGGRRGARRRHASSPTSRSARSSPRGARRRSSSRDDPMIKLALAVDADARAVRKQREDEVEGVEASQYALIAKAIFEDKGDSVYPDATFTLRLAFGTVKGYELDGKTDPALHHDRRRLRARRGPRQQGPLSSCPPSWHRGEDVGQARTSRRRSTSSRRPTSSAATRAARSSTATTRSSA